MPSAFNLLLAAKAISALGSQVTIVALPLTAVLFLHATALQMGLLGAAGALPGVLFGLIAGVAIEPLPKRAILLAANLASAALLAAIPAAHGLKLLSFALLLAVNFAARAIANAEGIALMSYIAAIVPKSRLAAANSRYSALMSAAMVGGPALAGFLILLLSAPGAISLDAASFIGAALLILLLPIIPPTGATTPEPITTRLRSGVAFMLHEPAIRRFTTVAVAINLFGGGIDALQPLFIVRQLAVPASLYGAALAIGGIGAVIGSLLAAPAACRLNINALLALFMAMSIMADSLVCALHGRPAHAAAGFALAGVINGICGGMFGAALMTYIQTVTPPEILARVIGALTTLVGASVPFGAFAAGAIATAIGLRPTLILETAAFAGTLVTFLLTTRRDLFGGNADRSVRER